jgi:UDP:flavonoid glycosyltransferase YjiC (YdhE family)
MNILFTVIPAAGHLNPTVPIALALQQRGHQVHYATGAGKIPVLRRWGLPGRAILSGRLDTAEHLVGPIKSHLNRHDPYSIFVRTRYMFDIVSAVLVELDKMTANWSPDLVVVDSHSLAGAAFAVKRGLPWLSTTQMPAALRTLSGTPAFLGGLSRRRHVGHRLRDLAGCLLLEVFRAVVSGVFLTRFRRLGMSLYGPNGGDGLYSPYAILAMACWEVEFPRHWPRHLHMIGPVNWSDASHIEEEDLTFLETKPAQPKILVTMGTHLAEEKAVFVPLLVKAFVGLPYRFIISLGGTAPSPDLLDWPDRYGATNVKITNYLPYEALLKRVEAVVHHGGAGIMYQCLAAGLPALVIPHDHDQFDNAQRIREMGAGLRLDPANATVDRLRQAVTELMENRAYRGQARRVATTLAQNYSPVAAAVSIIEQVGYTRQPVPRSAIATYT